MKKIITFTLALIGLSCIISSCSNTETYADKLKDQKKAIERLKSDSSFVFITKYPENGVFGEKEFYKDPISGAYFHVVDSGSGDKAVIDQTTVQLRFKGTFFLGSSSSEASNMNEESAFYNKLIEFRYKGMNATYISTSSDQISNYYFLSKVLAVPLLRVREGAIVKFIIPFEVGSGIQQYSMFEPVYMGYVHYSFQKR